MSLFDSFRLPNGHLGCGCIDCERIRIERQKEIAERIRARAPAETIIEIVAEVKRNRLS